MAARDGEMTLRAQEFQNSIPRPTATPGPAERPAWARTDRPFVNEAPAALGNFAPGFLRPERGPGALPYAPSRPAAASTPDRASRPAPLSTAGAAPSMRAGATPPTRPSFTNVAGGASSTARPGMVTRPTPVAGITEVMGSTDGSRVFTNAPGSTMSEMAGAGGRLPGATVSSGVPAPGVALSMATGGREQLRMPDIRRPQPSTFNNATPEMFARSDAIAAATGDWRSPIGIAARQLDDTYRNTRGLTRGQQAGATANYEGAKQALFGAAALPAAAATQQRAEAAQTERGRIGADAGVQQALLTRPRPQTERITLADGTLAQVGETGIARPVVGTDGQPVRPQRGRAPVDQAAYGKLLQENVGRLLGVDPISGRITDPDGNSRMPSAEELRSATQAARFITDEAFGGAAAAPSLDQWIAQARGANPGATDAELTAYYQQNYGN